MAVLIGGLVMKKRHFVLVIILIILGLFVAFSAASHPYDDPLTFIEHKTDDGRPIYTNMPKACFSKGRLTCDQLHPIFGMPVSTKKAESSMAKKSSATQGATLSGDLSASSSGPEVKLSYDGNLCHKKGTQYYDQTLAFVPYISMDACIDADGELPE
jgi:hypothetical protein